MGWKEYYKIDQSQFRDMYSNAQSWGELAPYKVTLQGTDYYGQGVVSSNATAWKQSPKIQHYPGYKTRIKIKYILWVDAGATGKADIGIVFYKNGDTSKDPQGNDVHGARHTVSVAPSVSTGELHEFVVEQDSGKIVWYVDGQKIDETTLEQPLQTFTIAIMIEDVSGGNIGIVVYEVVAEYYDWIEDLVSQMMNAMNIMVWVMMIVLMVTLVVKAFRGKR